MGYEFKDGYLHILEYGDQGDHDVVSIPLRELAAAVAPYLIGLNDGIIKDCNPRTPK